VLRIDLLKTAKEYSKYENKFAKKSGQLWTSHFSKTFFKPPPPIKTRQQANQNWRAKMATMVDTTIDDLVEEKRINEPTTTIFPLPQDALELSLDEDLLKIGVCRYDVGSKVDLEGWAETLSQVSPTSIFLEDGEFAQYRNILDDPSFPFNAIIEAISPCLVEHFIDNMNEVVLDDAFAIHYDDAQSDTTVKKHTDPSDITINLCLNRSADAIGSKVKKAICLCYYAPVVVIFCVDLFDILELYISLLFSLFLN
jgi:hypothetical protein